MLLSQAQWRRLLTFHETDLAGGALSFDFPDPFEDGQTLRLRFTEPPTRTTLGGDTYRARLSFEVLS